MATTLTFRDPASPATIINPAASGGFNTIGFYGPGFGLSVRVGEYNETSYRTTEDGQSNGGGLPNVRWANATGVYIGASIIAEALTAIANSEATLLVRLNTDAAVATQNTRFRTFDKSNIDYAPSGVTVQAAEVIRDGAGPGSGDTTWVTIAGSGTVLSLDDQATTATEHDWYIGISSKPDSIGEKTNFAFYFETEFL